MNKSNKLKIRIITGTSLQLFICSVSYYWWINETLDLAGYIMFGIFSLLTWWAVFDTKHIPD